MSSTRKLVPLFALILAALACNFGSGAPTEAPGAVETGVAATFTGLAPATSTPAPATVTAAASPTPPPAAATDTAPAPSATVPATPADAAATCSIAYVDNNNLLCVALGGTPQLLARAPAFWAADFVRWAEAGLPGDGW